jgi:hypothetical protein
VKLSGAASALEGHRRLDFRRLDLTARHEGGSSALLKKPRFVYSSEEFDQAAHQSGPSCLMVCSQTRAIIPVKVLMK